MTACTTCGTHLACVDGVCPTCVARSLTSLLRPLRGGSGADDVDETMVPGYLLGRVIGRGGMGVVYHATGLEDGLEAAVKLMPPHLGGHEEVAARFAREARALEAFDHPHILRVLDCGATRDGQLYLVTELAAGGDLAARLRQGPLVPAEAFRLFRQVLGAIAEAHRQGIVHRDIKPGNILLSAGGDALVGDFSLAKLLHDGGVPMLTLTQSNDIFGTPYYIAPEVRHSAAAVDHRADLFSLGVLLHEMLTGRLPIGSHEPASSLAKVPQDVDRLIARCLQEDPAKRPGTADEIQRELDEALAAPDRWTTALLVTSISALALALILWHPWSVRPVLKPELAITASKEKPWVNSLGMPFVPVPGTAALFCQWETRRREFGLFSQENAAEEANVRPHWKMPLAKVSPEHPVTPVTWRQSLRFCGWLTNREHMRGSLPASLRYRLPTDEEWSAAAGILDENGDSPEERFLNAPPKRAALYAWGKGMLPPLDTAFPANFAGQEVRPNGLLHRDAWIFTAPVASFPANALGLYDLSGNVAEWCGSNWNDHSPERVLRGGSWDDSSPAALRLDYRAHAPEDEERAGAGFRVVIARYDRPGWE